MENTAKSMTNAGAQSLVLGILTIVFGITTGVIGIINGGKLLRLRKKLSE